MGLVPTTFCCSLDVFEIVLKLQYHFDVNYSISLKTIKDKCRYEGFIFNRASSTKFAINFYQDYDINSNQIFFLEVLALDGPNNLFYEMYNSLKAFILQESIPPFREEVSISSRKEIHSSHDLPLPPSSPVPATSADISESIESLLQMIHTSLEMRREALKIFAETLLVAYSPSNVEEDDQYLRIVEGMYSLQVPKLFGDLVIFHVNQIQSSPCQCQPDQLFELHLLLLILSKIIHATLGKSQLVRITPPQVELDQLYSPLLVSLHRYITDSSQQDHNTKQTAEYIMRQLTLYSFERVSSLIGSQNIHYYLSPTAAASLSPANHHRKGNASQIHRENSRSPPLFCTS